MQYKFSYRKKDNGWQVILSYKVGLKWKQKSKQGFATKRQAQQYADALLSDAEASASLTTNPKLAGVTFGRFTEIYLEACKEDIRYGTWLMYRSSFRHFSALDDSPMTDITFLDVQDVLNEMKGCFSDYTIHTTIICIKHLFKAAAEQYHVITSSPIATLKSKSVHTTRKALNEDQLQKLLDTLHPEDIVDCIICLGATTGARLGEILGLCTTDVDLRHRQIHIRRQYTRTGRGPYHFGPVKNRNGVRTIPIPERTVHALETFLASRRTISTDGRIFPAPVRIRLAVNDRVHEIFGDGYTMHCLRHTYATRLVANGTDFRTVAALLGDTVTTVINNYSHYTDDMRQKAAEKIASMF